MNLNKEIGISSIFYGSETWELDREGRDCKWTVQAM